ncbi:MAG TPA: hypothetical protein VKZ43_06945 [Trueperaceae bacterium]|nr:hypothetical protein [Trueperaceae bacterium]
MRTSVIVRVVEGREGRRIVLHDLRTRQVHEFETWEAALKFVQAISDKKGLR